MLKSRLPDLAACSLCIRLIKTFNLIFVYFAVSNFSLMKKAFFLGLVLMTSIACNAQSDKKKTTDKKEKYVYNPANGGAPSGLPPAEYMSLHYYNFSSKKWNEKVDALYNQMTASQKAAQMIMVASSEALGFPYATSVKTSVSKEQAANVLFLKGSKKEFIKQNKELNAFEIAGLKPLYACDCEPTLLHNKFSGEKKMLATASLKTKEAVYSSVDSINALMDEMGILINFAPIVDIAANKAIINKRAFSNEPSVIQDLSSAFIYRTQSDNKAATVKHFPGHGAVTGDTHKQSVAINGVMIELNTFKNVIKKSNPLFVMVGHIAVKNNKDGFNTEGGRPATTSKKIITDLLRNQIGFNGIIVTDAMNMQASKNFPDADWEAAKAGADLVLMPLDAAKLNKKIATEIEKGGELGKQFEASVKRIIRLKIISQAQQ